MASFKRLILKLCVCVFTCVHESQGACIGQKNGSDALELEAVGLQLMWALGTELGPYVRVVHVLNC